MVYNELMNVIHTLTNVGGAAYNAAVQLGQNIYNGIKNALGIHSPGYIYHMMKDEIGRVDKLLGDSKTPLGEQSKRIGTAIADNFGTNINTTNKTTNVTQMPGELKVTLIHDFQNVPEHIDTQALTKAMNKGKFDSNMVTAFKKLFDIAYMNEKANTGS